MINDFLKECVREKPGASITASDLYEMYRDWCKEREFIPTTNTKFGRVIGQILNKKRTNKGYEYQDIEVIKPQTTLNNPIEPKHYTQFKITPVEVIEEWKLSYHLGNVVKYIARAGHKGDKLEDLKKAQWYLNREIKNMEGQDEKTVKVKDRYKQNLLEENKILKDRLELANNTIKNLTREEKQ